MAESREYITERQRKCRRDNVEPWKVDVEVAKTDAEAEEASKEDIEGQEADAEVDAGSAEGCRANAGQKR